MSNWEAYSNPPEAAPFYTRLVADLAQVALVALVVPHTSQAHTGKYGAISRSPSPCQVAPREVRSRISCENEADEQWIFNC